MLAIMIIISIISTVTVWQAFAKATRNCKSEGAITALYQIIAGITLLVFIPLEEVRITLNWRIWVLFATACIFYAINDRLMTVVYKNLPTAQVSVLKQLSSVFVIIIGLVISNDSFSIKNIMAAIMIIAGNVMILYERERERINRRRRYIVFGVMAAVSMAIALSLDINISSYYNLAIYGALSLIMPSIMIIIVDRTFKAKEVIEEFRNGDKKSIIIASVAQGIQIFTMLKAYQLGSVIIVAPLLALSVLTNALYELIILKEKSRWKVKILVSVIIFIAVIMDSM